MNGDVTFRHDPAGAPAPRNGRLPVGCSRGLAWQREPAAAAALPPNDLPVRAAPGRVEAWERLGHGVRSRLTAHVGEVLAWFAEESTASDARVRAVVIGTNGLAVAEPRLHDAGGGQYRPAYLVERIGFARSGLRQADVTHRPRAGLRLVRATGHAGPPRHSLRVDHGTRETLAGLPPLARALLEDPFTQRDEGIVRWESYWQSIGPTDRDPFIVLLVSGRYATFATGRRLIPVGHDSTTAHWELTCWSVPVVPRAGG